MKTVDRSEILDYVTYEERRGAIREATRARTFCQPGTASLSPR